ncbi:MAG: hypothetical protein ORN54_09025 [Cyclobacteriaceae bacterium]|nr:hypothetical protein [Cyclobacteriaceae bacterium]
MKKLFYVGITVLFFVFGFTAYRQNEKAEVYRDEKNKMHQELMKVRFEAQAARLEVAKLKQVIELERKNAQEMIQKAIQKK